MHDAAEPLPFQSLQYAFAAHIRDPHANPCPAGIEDRRMAIYRDLFFNNVDSLVAGSFPVIRKLLPTPAWRRLIRRFYAEHQAHTPLFPEVAREFLKYLETRAAADDLDPPFLFELAHYEWVELALDIDETRIEDVPHDPGGDVVDGLPVVSPVAWPLAYRFPVHHIRPDFQPTEPPEQPTCLIVVRNRRDDVAFMAATPLTLKLLQHVQEHPELTGRGCVEALAQPFDAASRATVVEAGTRILRDLRTRDVLLGTRVA
jgi:hypothetical protein